MSSLEVVGWEALTLTDDLVEILICLPMLTDHNCTCVACAAFHRVFTNPTFLRCLHTLHWPSLLSFHTFTGSFKLVKPPYPSIHAARALAGATDFRFSFLPHSTVWVVQDARDDRFIVDCDEHGDGTLTTIVVCDPLFRSYVLLPQIPKDLAATVQDPHVQQRSFMIGKHRCEIFLAQCGKKEEAVGDQPQSFWVIWMAQC
jgi:hypothetical protein